MNLKNARLLRQYKRLIAVRDEQLTAEMINRLSAPIADVFVNGTPRQRRKMANVLRSALPDKYSKRTLRRERAALHKAWNIAAARDGLL